MKTVLELSIEDMKKRGEMGMETYGKPLLPFNGRRASQDLYEELLDAVQYCKQLMLEEDAHTSSQKLLKQSVEEMVKLHDEVLSTCQSSLKQIERVSTCPTSKILARSTLRYLEDINHADS